MVSWRCDYCGSAVHGFEGEHGAYIGICQICGRGYGKPDDEDKQIAYDLAHQDTFQVLVLKDGVQIKNITRKMESSNIAYDIGCSQPVGSTVIIYNVTTGEPVDRFRVTDHYGWKHEQSDKEWLASERKVWRLAVL